MIERPMYHLACFWKVCIVLQALRQALHSAINSLLSRRPLPTWCRHGLEKSRPSDFAWNKLVPQLVTRTRFLPSWWVSLSPMTPSSLISTQLHLISSSWAMLYPVCSMIKSARLQIINLATITTQNSLVMKQWQSLVDEAVEDNELEEINWMLCASFATRRDITNPTALIDWPRRKWRKMGWRIILLQFWRKMMMTQME